MVSTLTLEEKYNRVRRSFCFYLDIQEHELARSISRRLQDMGLRSSAALTWQVTHVVSDRVARAAPPRRADAMLERVRPARVAPPPGAARYVHLTVQKAISLLDKLYDTFCTAQHKTHVRHFSKHFIKIEFLDKLCRPVYKEFDEWPEISLEPDPPRKEKETVDKIAPLPIQNTGEQNMTRKSRPRIKEEKEAGYCEMCNLEYADAREHARSAPHAAFVRAAGSYLALDSLIAGADVASFLRRASRRKLCDDSESVADPPAKRTRRSQSPHSPTPLANGDDERKHNTRTKQSKADEDRQYYKVVGVSTKLRSSGGFAKRKEPACNGTKPLVVKFRKIRRSEVSVLSDEAEQFMFPKRASSASSSSSDDDNEDAPLIPPAPAPPLERRRQARPLALKEESSEEDSWSEYKRRRKRRPPAQAKRTRRTKATPPPETTTEVETEAKVEPEPETEVQPEIEQEANNASPLREEPVERCMKWEDGRLKYTPAVEQLEFAFESVPRSEPWYETFNRQDQDQVATRNIPEYFALYSGSAPKLPYEMGPLPPPQPDCCPLSRLNVPPARYGTRAARPAPRRPAPRRPAARRVPARPRQSPREHASTRAILGAAGLLPRARAASASGDRASAASASRDRASAASSQPEGDCAEPGSRDASERLRQFLSDVFEDEDEIDARGEGDAGLRAAPDVSGLLSASDACDLIRQELQAAAPPAAPAPAPAPAPRRARLKKNRTGWPRRRKRARRDSAATARGSDDDSEDAPSPANETDDLTLDLKLLVQDDAKDKEDKSASEPDDKEESRPRVRRPALALGDWLQPVVRVARVEARRLRSAAPAPPAALSPAPAAPRARARLR